MSFYYRPDSRADRGVMRQIFEQQDYNLSHWSQGRRLMEYYQSLTSPALIIDAGANIGASALYFLNCYRKSQVFALEPSLENWKLLELNTANHEFDVVHRGENLFLFNRKILSIK